MIIYSSYALAFWYGVKLIMDDREKCFDSVFEDCDVRYDASSLLVVFFSVLLGAMNVGQATPYVEAFSMAKGAASTIFAVIDRKPPIDSLSESGERPEGPERNIRFQDVVFKYPARPDIPILQGLTLEIKQGKYLFVFKMGRILDFGKSQLSLSFDLKTTNQIQYNPRGFRCSANQNNPFGHMTIFENDK